MGSSNSQMDEGESRPPPREPTPPSSDGGSSTNNNPVSSVTQAGEFRADILLILLKVHNMTQKIKIQYSFFVHFDLMKVYFPVLHLVF